MRSNPDWRASVRSFEFLCLAAFLLLLWIAGGASRADVMGQFVVRLAAWAIVLVLALRSRLDWRSWCGAGGAIIALCILAVSAQLVPLPPAVWMHLPGRAVLSGAATIAGQDQPWRPLTISPSATWNALGSLIVPVAAFVLSARLNRAQHRAAWQVVFFLAMFGCMVAALQFSGARFDNPLINYVPGTASGNFANRNHFALFLCIGLLAFVAGFRGSAIFEAHGRALTWAAIAVLSLTMLATGSRAGFVLFVAAIAVSAGILYATISRHSRRSASKTGLASRFAAPALVILLLGAAVYFGRAVSFERAASMSIESDPRTAALPTLLDLVAKYFPVGSGFGAFDRVFRIDEPDALLRPLYFNHAHNDWIEIVLDGGLVSVAIAAWALFWVLRRTWRHWQTRMPGDGLGLATGAIIVVTCLASLSDYPARTPMIMAVLALAAAGLALPIREDAVKTPAS